MKQGSLFLDYLTGMLEIAFLVSLESSPGGGVHWLGFIVIGLAV